MRLCIFADIHGNAPAFRAAYKSILTEAADVNVFAGDLCGYYYDQIAIYEELRSVPNLVAIRGNHDKMFLALIDGDEDLRRQYAARYGRSMEHLMDSDHTNLLAWLRELPEQVMIDDVSIAVYHGAPWNVNEGYVYPDSPLEEFRAYRSSCFVLAHTHYSMVRSIDDKLVVNPGSLGQPRNGKGPSYAVFESTTKDFIVKEFSYDKAELLKRIAQIGDTNTYIRKILDR